MAALTLSKIKCLQCRRVRDSGVEQKFAFTTSMPPQKNSNTSVCITECLDIYSDPDIVEVDCNDCGIKKKASKWMQLTDLSPYVRRIRTPSAYQLPRL